VVEEELGGGDNDGEDDDNDYTQELQGNNDRSTQGKRWQEIHEREEVRSEE